MSLTGSLIAVLIPLLFMGDMVGRLFREFAVTLAVTILVSAFVSLTLTPTMCALLLRHKPESERSRLYHASERFFEKVIEYCGTTLRWVLNHQPLPLFVTVATLAATLFLYMVVPKGFFPVQIPALSWESRKRQRRSPLRLWPAAAATHKGDPGRSRDTKRVFFHWD